MAAKRKYTAKKLKEEVERYVKSISRIITVTELVPTEELDRYGHPVLKPEPVHNLLGEEIKCIEFAEPPTKEALASRLGVHPSTYSKWEDEEKYPEYQDTLMWFDAICRMWLKRELLRRDGRDTKGIIFDLENNYGYTEKQEVTVAGALEDYIRGMDGGTTA